MLGRVADSSRGGGQMTDGRDREKQGRRDEISEAAWSLFAERGFDGVTLSEIAVAADGPVYEIFDWFPSREALFFDRIAELSGSPDDAVRAREPGESAVAAFLRWHDATVAFLCDPGGAVRARRFFEIVDDSPSLQSYERALDREYRAAVTASLAESAARDEADLPALLAAQLTGIHRYVVDLAKAMIREGVEPRVMRKRLAAATSQGITLLSERALEWGAQRPG
jgi:AcrR family transcriptional regulator